MLPKPPIGFGIRVRIQRIIRYGCSKTRLRKQENYILKAGRCTVKNMGSGTIRDGDRVVPVDGGCDQMTATGQHSLGVAKQEIQPGMYGLLDIQPDEEKPNMT